MMKFTVQDSGGVPPNIYTNAIFDGIDVVPANVEKGYKPGFRFKFKITEGPHAGAIASRIPGGERPTTRNGLGRFLAELTGVALADGVNYDIEPLIGQKFTIVVKQSDGGGTRVDTVIPIK
jgi:hypothetical protein